MSTTIDRPKIVVYGIGYTLIGMVSIITTRPEQNRTQNSELRTQNSELRTQNINILYYILFYFMDSILSYYIIFYLILS